MLQHARTRSIGILMVVSSALAFSTMGLFAKGVSAGASEIIFWRGLAAAAFTLSYIALRGTLRSEARAFNRPALAVVLLGASGTAAFIPALKLTTIANVTMIYGAAPFVAAGLSWWVFSETPTRRVGVASLLAFVGVVIVVGGGLSTGGTTGDALALWMTLMIAATIVIYRRFPQTTAALPAALQSFILIPVAAGLGAPFDIALSELPLLIGFGLIFAIASVTLSEGARRLASGETALLSILELPVAPILAFLVLAEMPSRAALWGGGIILAAIIWSQRR